MYIYKAQKINDKKKDPEIVVVNFMMDSFPKPYFFVMKRNGNMMDVEPELFFHSNISEFSVYH